MSEFEDRLNALLSDPAEMEKISRLAAELMGGELPKRGGDSDAAVPEGLMQMLSGMGTSGEKTALIRAMLPYLRPERQQKLQKAMRMAKLAKAAMLAIETI